LTDAPSMAMNELDLPALNGSLAGRRSDEPAGGGGVDVRAGSRVAQQDRNGATRFGGELKTAGFDAGQPLRRRDHHTHAFAAQALGDRPVLIGDGFRMQDVHIF